MSDDRYNYLVRLIPERSGPDLNVSKNLISDWERGVKRPGTAPPDGL
jgi:hypothetical protein